MARKQGRKDTELIISWLKENLEYYKKNRGGVTRFWTPITKKIIDATLSRIRQLENKL